MLEWFRQNGTIPRCPANHARPFTQTLDGPRGPSNCPNTRASPPSSCTVLVQRKSFSCNTYGSPRKYCKQRTYGMAKSFRCNIYKKQGGGGPPTDAPKASVHTLSDTGHGTHYTGCRTPVTSLLRPCRGYQSLPSQPSPVLSSSFSEGKPAMTDARSPFATVEEAVEEIRQGCMIVLVDDEDRENEGDLA